MTERQTLFAVLTAVYLAECLFWVRRGAVVFRRGTGAWSVRVEGEVARNDRGDLHWAWPLPPFGGLAIGLGMPFSLGPRGVLNATADGFHPSGRPLQTPSFLAWEDLRTIAVEGRSLKVDGGVFWKGDSQHEPLRLGRLLNSLRKADASARPALFRDVVRGMFDLEAIRARRKSVDESLVSVRRLSGALAALLFVATPLALVWKGWFPTLYVVLPAMFLLTGLLARRCTSLHRGWKPDAGEERFRLALTLFLSPASAMRAADPLQRPAFEEFHPTALACVFLDGAERRRFLAAAWRDLMFPRLPECAVDRAEARETEASWRAEVRQALEATARAVGEDPSTFGAAPKPTDPSHTRYCPRCEAQFTASADTCRECGGRALVPLAPAVTS